VADYAIDSSSVLVFAFGEPGAEMVVGIAADDRNHLFISSVNMAEVLAKMIDKGIPIDTAGEIIAPLALDEIPFDHWHAFLSSELREVTRHHGLSLGDRSCLALGLSKKVPVLTSDRKWLDVSGKIRAEIVITRPEAGPRPH
jgi:PIN domain nuclease of toxin-antitoxin system